MQVRSVSAPSPLDSRSGTINFTETATTILIAGRMGVSDKLDIGVDAADRHRQGEWLHIPRERQGRHPHLRDRQ